MGMALLRFVHQIGFVLSREQQSDVQWLKGQERTRLNYVLDSSILENVIFGL